MPTLNKYVDNIFQLKLTYFDTLLMSFKKAELHFKPLLVLHVADQLCGHELHMLAPRFAPATVNKVLTLANGNGPLRLALVSTHVPPIIAFRAKAAPAE